MNILYKIFKTKNPVIGALHFSPLPGFKGFTSLDLILKKSLEDLKAFERGGVHGIIIENNYDFPHKAFVDPETIAAMTYLGDKIKNATKLPVGVSVLWNDYRASLSIAKAIGGKFVRIPVFVDDVKTDFGVVNGVAKEAIRYREIIKAKDVAIFADIQVKHSTMINKTKTLTESYKEAFKEGADAVIITGEWTGNAPAEETVRELLKHKRIPILIGSGVDNKNIRMLSNVADGFIVATSLKSGKSNKTIINIKSYEEEIDERKVKALLSSLNE